MFPAPEGASGAKPRLAGSSERETEGSAAMRALKFIASVTALTCSLGLAQQRDLKVEPIRVNRRLAPVMGNVAYRGEPLVNPLNDAAAVADGAPPNLGELAGAGQVHSQGNTSVCRAAERTGRRADRAAGGAGMNRRPGRSP